MKLLLTSAGIIPEVKDDFLFLLSKAPSEVKIALVETAIHGESLNPEKLKKYQEQTLAQIHDCGITKIRKIDFREIKPSQLSKELSEVDVLLVDGGNTFYLLNAIKRNELGKVIVNKVKKGLIYLGISAGSYIACPTIEMALWGNQDRNRCGLKDISALHIVPFLLTAHYTPEYRPVIENAVKTTKYPVAALTDSQALLVVNGKIKLLGKGKKNFFNGFKEG